jgi:phosphatidate cytidylyltransferase
MLGWRLLSAAVGIPLVIAVVALGGPLYGAVLVVALCAAAAELLVQVGLSVGDPRLLSTIASVAALASVGLVPASWRAAVVAASLALVFTLWSGWRAGVSRRWWLGAVLATYVGGLGGALMLLRFGPSGRAWVLFTLFVTFASDTGAYAIGRLLGRHRLAPAISPGKTLEGALGGLAAAVLAAEALSHLLRLALGPVGILALAPGVSRAAQTGDLFESALKRRLQLKDAGVLVPGHGGLLDRLDSLLFSGAMVYCVVKWMSL